MAQTRMKHRSSGFQNSARQPCGGRFGLAAFWLAVRLAWLFSFTAIGCLAFDVYNWHCHASKRTVLVFTKPLRFRVFCGEIHTLAGGDSKTLTAFCVSTGLSHPNDKGFGQKSAVDRIDLALEVS